METIKNYFSVDFSLIDFIFDLLKYIYLAVLLFTCILMLIHVINNPEQITFGGF